jgi:hypothetical protein
MKEQIIPNWHEKKKSAVKLGNAVQKTLESLANLSTEVPDVISERIMEIHGALLDSFNEVQNEAFFEFKGS